MKATGDLAVMLGWNVEAFARTKRMKPLGEYIKPTKPKTADDDARDVRRMFDRLIVKQEAADGDG